MVGAHGQSGIELSDWHLDDRVTRDLDRILGRADAEGDAELAAPKFSEYPAQPYTGPRAPALAVDADGRVERDREPLAVALGGSPNFAGRIVLVRLSCGAGCEHAVLVDVASGAVAYPPALAALPAPVSCASRDALLYRRDSRLITVTGRDGEELVTRYFVWEAGGGPLKPVAALAGASEERCPARD